MDEVTLKNSRFISEQVITYLGNKRKLIGFIDDAVEEVIKSDPELAEKDNSEITFFDIFSGSGVVSRYGKQKGFKTLSNDLEEYSFVINKTMLTYNEDDAQAAFKEVAASLNIEVKNGDYYQSALDYFNALKVPNERYFSIHYAPKDTQHPNFDTERLFYTQENASKIDAIVEIIFQDDFNPVAKDIILTSLMYNMTIHINTSGTMKGFHNGWGGKGGAALDRILGDIVLTKIPLIDSKAENLVFCEYAEKVFEKHSLGEVDIIYADPPYNQHQYSANYNHLTTIVRNDKYNPGPVVKGSRAGIRVDHTRSDFCRSVKDKELDIKMAEKAFIDFISSVKAKHIIMSYNNEGVVGIESLLDILSQEQKNTLKIKYRVYDKYKGGKSTKTSNKVVEYLLIIDMNKKQDAEEFVDIKKELLITTQKNLFSDRYINYHNLSHQVIDNQAIILSDTGVGVLSIDKTTYRVQEDYLDHIDDIEMVKFVLDHEIDRIEVIKRYIIDGNIDLAIKMIGKLTNKSVQEEKASLLELLKEKMIDKKKG